MGQEGERPGNSRGLRGEKRPVMVEQSLRYLRSTMARPLSDEKRNALLAAAIDLFSETGIDATPTAAISKASTQTRWGGRSLSRPSALPMVKLPAGMGIIGGSMTRSLIVRFRAGSLHAPPRLAPARMRRASGPLSLARTGHLPGTAVLEEGVKG